MSKFTFLSKLTFLSTFVSTFLSNFLFEHCFEYFFEHFVEYFFSAFLFSYFFGLLIHPNLTQPEREELNHSDEDQTDSHSRLDSSRRTR